VRLAGPGDPAASGGAGPLTTRAVAFATSPVASTGTPDDRGDVVGAALDLAVDLAAQEPWVGEGATADLWECLATLGATDLSAARAVEPHLDARTILHQAGLGELAPAGSTWGVFAAEGPGVRLSASPAAAAGAATAEDWLLSGVKPWCSLAGRLSHALVTAWTSPEDRRLFAVDLRHPGVRADGAWSALGLTDVPSGPVSFDAVPAVPVGEAGWYLRRPGFAWGGASVAACWHGGVVGLARTLLVAAREPRRADDALLQRHVGAVDAWLDRSRQALAATAAAVDAGLLDEREGPVVVARTRTTVADAAERVLEHVAHALGPAPLAQDAAHARRVADLGLYVRQHHPDRDVASLGRKVLALPGGW